MSRWKKGGDLIERDLSPRVQTLFVTHELLLDIAVTVPSSEWVQPGEKVPVALPLDRLVFFDGRTETRIG
jgi:hypothetical protein